jgi:polysaccharide export outer membrane protein
VWRETALTATVPVRTDGKVTTPLVEDMVAVGKTPAILARDIEKVLGEYVRSPTVNVIVVAAASAMSQVKVIGQVKVPQSMAYRDGLKVMDAVVQAGGLTDFAAPNRATIVRGANGSEQQIKVRVGDLMLHGNLKHNLALKPGDILVIPQSRF